MEEYQIKLKVFLPFESLSFLRTLIYKGLNDYLYVGSLHLLRLIGYLLLIGQPF